MFIAEIGDKTQLATMIYATDQKTNLFFVFLGSATALITAAAPGVFAGALAGKYVSPSFLQYASGAGFITIGVWAILKT